MAMSLSIDLSKLQIISEVKVDICISLIRQVCVCLNLSLGLTVHVSMASLSQVKGFVIDFIILREGFKLAIKIKGSVYISF